MRYSSFAGAARGKTDPTEVRQVAVDEKCGRERCDGDCDHMVIIWSGNEYSKNHTWISAEEAIVIPLDDAR